MLIQTKGLRTRPTAGPLKLSVSTHSHAIREKTGPGVKPPSPPTASSSLLLSSPLLSSPHLSFSLLSSPLIFSPFLFSSLLSAPHLFSPLLTFPLLTSSFFISFLLVPLLSQKELRPRILLPWPSCSTCVWSLLQVRLSTPLCQ